jgi:hypothetical protein
VIGTEELPDGYAFRVPGDGKWIAVVAELIVAERECCPFTFELAAYPNMGPVIVRITGPAGTKDFLRTILMQARGVYLAFWTHGAHPCLSALWRDRMGLPVSTPGRV